MLTISQLAAYAGVTVRAVRHYHAKGLLPEPDADHSGYRRYDAAAVVALIRIRTLAEAGVPLARVQELLAAGEEAFAEAVDEIDRRLRAEIRELEQHRRRIAQLGRATAWRCRPRRWPTSTALREIGVPEAMVEASGTPGSSSPPSCPTRCRSTCSSSAADRRAGGAGLYRDLAQ